MRGGGGGGGGGGKNLKSLVLPVYEIQVKCFLYLTCF